MFLAQSLKASVLVAAIGLSAGAALLAPPASAGADKTVKCEKLQIAKVKAACTAVKGDFGKVKKFMKETTKDQINPKSKGKFKCKDCHKDTKTYGDLTDNAMADLKAVLK